MAKNTSELCASAERFKALLEKYSLTRADVVQALEQDGRSDKEIRNVKRFLFGLSKSASRDIQDLLIEYAKKKNLSEPKDASFFEVVPSFLKLTEQMLTSNRGYSGLINANCGWFQLFMLDSTDLELANKQQLRTPRIRNRELRIFPDGGGTYGFEFDLHRRPTRGFVAATPRMLHLVGYEQKRFETMVYICLVTEPQRVGLTGVSLCGSMLGQAVATKSIPVNRAVARRVALVSKSAGSPDIQPSESVIDWLAGRRSKRGANAGLITEFESELPTDSD